MNTLVEWLNKTMTGRFGVDEGLAGILDSIFTTLILLGLCITVNWGLQSLFRWIASRNNRLKRSNWHIVLVRRKLGHNILLLIPGILFYLLVSIAFKDGDPLIRTLHRFDIIYMIVVGIRICNSILMAFLDEYSKTDKYKSHPLQGLIQGLQVALYFVGGIIIVAVLIDKSPTVLLTGLGASAAVLMLVFKDSILGFVAGVQLSQNDMIRIGDWIQMPDSSANGNVEEITLNTVKVRNWDNTLTMIPPYTLVTTPFKNWRGMQESAGRRADKSIFIDVNTLEICTPDMISDICKAVPLLSGHVRSLPPENQPTTNIQMYRQYIELYLRSHPEVNADLDIIVTQKEATAYGVPVYVYFFLRDKAWASFERKQSDIFDHLMSIAPEFALRIYQRP